jgi:hypothetical protein
MTGDDAWVTGAHPQRVMKRLFVKFVARLSVVLKGGKRYYNIPKEQST